MSKLQAAAEAIKATKAMLDTEADKLMVRIMDINKAAPAAIAKSHAFLDMQKADVSEIESTLATLTNLPLDGSAS